MNKYLTVAKVNFRRTTWIAYLVAGICALAIIIDLFIDNLLGLQEQSTVAAYCMLYLVALLAPIFIASVNYTKLMHIGVKKKTYFWACLINYVVFSAVISLIGVLEYYLLDVKMNVDRYKLLSLIPVWGWDTSIVSAFFSQFAFLFFAQTLVHTLVFMQTRWYGIAADILIVAIISVFTPIPVLRSAEVFFFRFLLFEQPAIIHIAVGLILGTLIYATNLFYLKKR